MGAIHAEGEGIPNVAWISLIITVFGFIGSCCVILCIVPTMRGSVVKVRRTLVLLIACGDSVFSLIKVVTSASRVFSYQSTTDAICQHIGPVDFWSSGASPYP